MLCLGLYQEVYPIRLHPVLSKPQHTLLPHALYLGWEDRLLSYQISLQLQWGRLHTGYLLMGREIVSQRSPVVM